MQRKELNENKKDMRHEITQLKKDLYTCKHSCKVWLNKIKTLEGNKQSTNLEDNNEANLNDKRFDDNRHSLLLTNDNDDLEEEDDDTRSNDVNIKEINDEGDNITIENKNEADENDTNYINMNREDEKKIKIEIKEIENNESIVTTNNDTTNNTKENNLLNKNANKIAETIKYTSEKISQQFCNSAIDKIEEAKK